MGIRRFFARFFFLLMLILVFQWVIIEVTGDVRVFAFEVGARALGMGGAFTAVADDASAPFWNPAAITQIEHVGLISNLGGGGEGATGDGSSPGSSTAWPNFWGNYSRAVSTGRYSLSQYFWFDAELPAPSSDYDVKAVASNNLTLATPINTAWLGWPGLNFLAVGGDVRYAAFGSGKGVATGLTDDAGVLAKWSERWSGGVVVQDLFTKSREGTVDNAGKPLSVKIDPNWRAGLAYRPDKATTLAVDLEGPNFYSGKSAGVHLGVEKRFFDVLALRGGLAFWSGVRSYNFGVGLKLGSLRLDVGNGYISGASNRVNLIGTAIIQF